MKMTKTELENERRELFKQAEKLLTAESEKKRAPAKAKIEAPPSATALSFADSVIKDGRANESERFGIARQFDQANQDDLLHPVGRGEKTRIQLLRNSQFSRPLTPQAIARQDELLSHTALGRQILNGDK